MNKKVNIYPKTPVLSINPPIRSAVRKVTKSTEEIRECIIARAIVEEILPDGSTVRLNFSNYDKNNTPSKLEQAAKITPRKAIVIDNNANSIKAAEKKDNTAEVKTEPETVEKASKVEDKTTVQETITVSEDPEPVAETKPIINNQYPNKKKFDKKNNRFGENRYKQNNDSTTTDTDKTTDETVETKDAESLNV